MREKNYDKRNENICEANRSSTRIKWRYVLECGNSEQIHLSAPARAGCKCCPEKCKVFFMQSDFLV